MVIMDVDGVLTDGGMYYGKNGEVLKKFNTRDGMGIQLLHQAGIKTAIITQERTDIIAHRAKKLEIKEVYQGIKDKCKALDIILRKNNFNYDEVAYIGDDINDISILNKVGFAVCPKDAHKDVKENVDYICSKIGGQGAVRELCELIISNKVL